MATKKKPVTRKRRSRKQPADRNLKVLLAVLFLLGFLVAALAALTHLQRHARPVVVRATPPAATVPGAATVTGKVPSSSDLQLVIERALWRGGISFAGMEVATTGQDIHYHLASAFPGSEWLDLLREALRQQAPEIAIRQAGGDDEQVVLAQTGKERIFLHFQSAPVKTPARRPRARIAIVVDDLGRDLHAVRALLSIDLDLTMAVMPEEPHTRQAAELSHSAGREVLVHMPMEPQSYPRNNPGPGALLLGQDDAEIRRLVLRMFERVPHAVGGNNHMGSRFTQYREGMQSVLAVMREHGWFFVDSRTSPMSLGAEESRKAHVPCTERDIFLDNTRNVEAIARQLQQTVKLARSRHRVVAICHPYPETIQALRQEAAFLRQQDIEVVPVSRLLSREPQKR